MKNIYVILIWLLLVGILSFAAFLAITFTKANRTPTEIQDTSIFTPQTYSHEDSI